MSSPKELRQKIVDARAGLQGALHVAPDRWETKPASREGEEAWCAREVAQHVIGAEWFFTNMIAQACGAPPMDRPEVDASSPAKAAMALSRIGSADDNILRHVSDGDLSKTFNHPRFGESNVEQMMETMISHTRDHTQQLETLNGMT